MSGVSSLELRYLDDRGEWQRNWPAPLVSGESELAGHRRRPRAIEFTLTTEAHGTIRRIVEVPR
jgi:general secretion pathway protein J